MARRLATSRLGRFEGRIGYPCCYEAWSLDRDRLSNKAICMSDKVFTRVPIESVSDLLNHPLIDKKVNRFPH